MTELRDTPAGHPDYVSSRLRSPRHPLVAVHHDTSGPVSFEVGPDDHDLTREGPIGERILVHGRVVDTGDRPLTGTLIELWQANAAGRYRHASDNHDAPLDPGFTGSGRCLTDDDGRYEFVTIKPGPYPWGNHWNAWRPAHIHFSLFGRSFTQRLVTQMYFPGDPLFYQDPIFHAAPSPERLIARLDLSLKGMIAYEFDIVLRGVLRDPG